MLYYIPGCLPDFFPTTEPSLINWGKRNDGSTIVLSWSTIINAYNEIVRWEKMCFCYHTEKSDETL